MKLLLYCRHECCICDSRIGRNEIHHINSNPGDNRDENLILLCPNCHKQSHDGLFKAEELLWYKNIKINKVGNKKIFEEQETRSENFPDVFSIKLNEIVNSLEREQYDPTLSDKIDELIMLLKEQIEKWNVPLVRFGTKELFLKLYQYSGDIGENKLKNLYVIYEDLFLMAYSQRKHILGKMIEVFFSIWIETWTTDYNIERAEKCIDILLRLSIDFLDKDVTIVESCFYEIDNAAGDMFEPEIFSREILLGALIESKSNEKELGELLETIIEYIQKNDVYSHDDEKWDYLIDSIEYAERIQDNYAIDVSSFKEKYLIKMIEENKNSEVGNFIDFLTTESFKATRDDFDINFCGELLELIIVSYDKIFPGIGNDILFIVSENKNVSNYLNEVIDKRNYLKYLFKGEKMITSINDFIEFIENNSHFEESKIGMGFWGLTILEFKYSLKSEETQELKNISNKYNFTDLFELEICEDCITFEADYLINKKGKEGVMEFINFLKTVDKIVKISTVATGIEFKFK